jgi:PAS domain S-box-containing protein
MLKKVNEDLVNQIHLRESAEIKLREYQKNLEEQVQDRTRELQDSEKLFRTVFENSYIGKILTTPEGNFMKVNPAFCGMLGYNIDEIQGINFARLTHPDDMTISQECIRKLLSGELNNYRFNKRYLHRDGKIIWTEVNTALLRNNENKPHYFVTIVQDITERKYAEKALLDATEAFKGYFNMGTVGMCVTSLEKGWVEVNNRLCNMLGYSKEELKQLTWEEMTHPDDLSADVKLFNGVLAGELESYELDKRFIRKDGQIIYTSLSVTCQRNIDGTVHHILATLIDITERKYAEEEILKLNATLEERVVERTAQLEYSNNELEAFTYSVSHDLRAPLRAIGGFSRFLLEDYAEKLDSEGKRFLNIILSNTEKMDHLISDLLSLSRVTKGDIKYLPIDMDSIVRSVIEDVALKEVWKKFKLTVNPLANNWGDAFLLRQVWFNLISNAIKYSMKSDIKEIEIGSFLKDKDQVYYIKDSGVGFDPEYMDKLFGVFQRLHKTEEFEGNGIGLALVKRIVHRHDGHVWAEGKINKGATFYFALPGKEKIQ